MSSKKTIVMDETTIRKKIKRIAWELYERHIDEAIIYLVGINGTGYQLAERIKAAMVEIGAPKCELIKLSIDKKNPLGDKEVDIDTSKLESAAVVVIDDVLNSGSTLIHGVMFVLQCNVAKCTTAVLVDRNHKRFPIKADVKGLSLSTSLQNHVEVDLEGTPNAAFLE